MNDLAQKGLWVGVSLLGAASMAVLALSRGETVNAVWMVLAATCTYAIGYRFYSRFIATKVLELDATRPTPAVRVNDGLDYVPTNNFVLFGHHFAAIAGAGPLIGPVLAAQMGKPLRRIRQDMAETACRQIAEERKVQAPLHLAALRRILDREEPDYAE